MPSNDLDNEQPSVTQLCQDTRNIQMPRQSNASNLKAAEPVQERHTTSMLCECIKIGYPFQAPTCIELCGVLTHEAMLKTRPTAKAPPGQCRFANVAPGVPRRRCPETQRRTRQNTIPNVVCAVGKVVCCHVTQSGSICSALRLPSTTPRKHTNRSAPSRACHAQHSPASAGAPP